jgi:DNA-binding NtrC family response regulator
MPNKSTGSRVLVVDDELLIRWSISETLKRRGYHVVEAADAAAARRAVADSPSPFAAVVLDYRLPDSNDLSLLAHIRNATPDSPVVLITAFGTREVLEGARQLGVYAVMDKPFDISDLESTVARACASGPH